MIPWHCRIFFKFKLASAAILFFFKFNNFESIDSIFMQLDLLLPVHRKEPIDIIYIYIYI